MTPWTSNKLYTAIDTSWLRVKRTPKKSCTMEDLIDMLFGSQSMCENPNKNRRRSDKYQNRPFLKSKLRCWNCNQAGHFSTSCTKPRIMAKIVHAIMCNSPVRSKRTLFELCHQFDNIDRYSDNSSTESDSESEESKTTKAEGNIVDGIHKIFDNDIEY